VALPEQIRKQSAAVQELYKQMAEPEGEKPEGEQPPAGDDYVNADAPQPVVAPPPAADEQTPAGERVAEEPVLQKYKTLQGMYNAEVPRLHQQGREQQQRIAQLEQLLASVSAQQQVQQRPTEAVLPKHISDKDVEEYGDSLDVMRRASREELAPVMQRIANIEAFLQQVQSNMVPQLQQVQQRQAQSAEQMFWAGLTDNVSNWREINDNPDFQSWLMQVDPLTGITRQVYLEDAQRALDARRVSQFFRTWLEANGQAAVAQTNGQRKPSAAASELERQVAPGRSKNPGAPNSNKGKVYTPQDITNFFNDVKQGRYKGKEQERDRIERDIFAAQRENRIQTNA